MSPIDNCYTNYRLLILRGFEGIRTHGGYNEKYIAVLILAKNGYRFLYKEILL